ncbi:rod shape-determining protein MreC [Polluticoccus soli]|uniref:rod shape-determining protein MreC n=1 Tax=Polluticoccus soli TaxID=3034150 RepID=UPI0023E30E88|nr:rod shape-determining protein MreC [Flavipsychrobacter sp. JY13-12]
MRNLILFIRRFFNLILFLILEIICIILIGRTNTLQGNDLMSSANSAIGLMYKKQNDVVYYFGLKAMNDSLLAENIKLRTQMAQYLMYDTLKDTAVRRAIPGDSATVVKYADYFYRTARVINNSVSSENNYITLNRGAAHGIERNMAVISGTGVVGKVVHVSENYSSVLSVLSVKQQVSAKLKDGTVGYVSWSGERPDALVMKDVPQQIKVKKGDSVFTTSYSFFPQDVLVGTVVKTEPIKKNNLQLLHLRTATNFRNVQYVYVVENKMMPERKKLEDSVKKIK